MWSRPGWTRTECSSQEDQTYGAPVKWERERERERVSERERERESEWVSESVITSEWEGEGGGERCERAIKFVRHISQEKEGERKEAPRQRLVSYLHSGVKEGQCKEHRSPLRQVTDFQLLLCDNWRRNHRKQQLDIKKENILLSKQGCKVATHICSKAWSERWPQIAHSFHRTTPVLYHQSRSIHKKARWKHPTLALTSVCSLQTGLDTLRRLIGELDRNLQQRDWELGVHFGRHPQTELVVHRLRLQNKQEQLVHEVQAKMAVLKKRPAAVAHELLQQGDGRAPPVPDPCWLHGTRCFRAWRGFRCWTSGRIPWTRSRPWECVVCSPPTCPVWWQR